MFEGQRSAASIGIKSRNERVGSMPKPAYAIQTIAKGAGITLSRRACRRSSDEHRRREGMVAAAATWPGRREAISNTAVVNNQSQPTVPAPTLLRRI